METKQSKSSRVVLITVITLIGLGTMFVNASDKWWNPPGPPGPTMKSLDEVEARTPIKASDLPLTIDQSGSYYLTETINFTIENTNGITINASDVTIDLNGYALIGPGMEVGSSGHGIYGSGDQISVLNGSIRNWRDNGISLTGSNHQVRDIQVRNNGGNGISVGNSSVVTGCTSIINEGIGINVDTRSIIKDCSSTYSNHSQGFYLGDSCTISNCIARSNNTDGIYTGSDSVVENCVATENSSNGIRVGSRSVIRSCTANNNDGIGIDCGSGDNVISNCVTIGNGTGGIFAYYSKITNCVAKNQSGTDNYGIQIKDDCLVIGNVCVENEIGIYAPGGSYGNTIRSNSLTNNDTGLNATDHNYAAENTFYGNTTNWTGSFTHGSHSKENVVIP